MVSKQSVMDYAASCLMAQSIVIAKVPATAIKQPAKAPMTKPHKPAANHPSPAVPNGKAIRAAMPHRYSIVACFKNFNR